MRVLGYSARAARDAATPALILRLCYLLAVKPESQHDWSILIWMVISIGMSWWSENQDADNQAAVSIWDGLNNFSSKACLLTILFLSIFASVNSEGDVDDAQIGGSVVLGTLLSLLILLSQWWDRPAASAESDLDTATPGSEMNRVVTQM